MNTSEMLPRELTLIVAATNKMGIGKAGTLPWTGLKKEMAYFARVTKRTADDKTNSVIMGRKTWDSIPERFRPLKDRTNIFITRSNPETSGALVAHSLEEAISMTETQGGGRAFVIGGAQIYKQAAEMKEARRILLTRILGEFECDTFFPVVLPESGVAPHGGWRRKEKRELDEWVGECTPEGVQVEGGTEYVFEMWERVEE